MSQIHDKDLIQSRVKTQHASEKLQNYIHSLAQMSDNEQQIGARQFAFSLTQTYAASLLLEYAQWSLQKNKDTLPIITAKRWCAKNLSEPDHFSETYRKESKALAMDYYDFH